MAALTWMLCLSQSSLDYGLDGIPQILVCLRLTQMDPAFMRRRLVEEFWGMSNVICNWPTPVVMEAEQTSKLKILVDGGIEICFKVLLFLQKLTSMTRKLAWLTTSLVDLEGKARWIYYSRLTSCILKDEVCKITSPVSSVHFRFKAVKEQKEKDLR